MSDGALEQGIRLLFETAQLMIPVVTGFLALYLGALSALWQKAPDLLRARQVFAAAPVLLGVLSLGVWSGTLPFCIRATIYQSEGLFRLGQSCAQASHILFFAAVTCGAFFFITVMRGGDEKVQHSEL